MFQWFLPPKNIEVIDIIQILLIAYFVYRIIIRFRDTRAHALLRGVLVIVVFIVLVNILQMDTIVWLIKNLSVVAITAVVIIFQPELRKGLEGMGHRNVFSSFFKIGKLGSDLPKLFSDQTLNDILRAVYELSENRTGALIVIEQKHKLYEHIETGILIDAVVSDQLIMNIFEDKTPLHDGAVIIRENRIMAATCYLPLSERTDVSKKLGTRHRAGLGISEISDSFTIIVSEETGNVSYAYEGILTTGVGLSDMRDMLHKMQRPDSRKNPLFSKKEDSES